MHYYAVAPVVVSPIPSAIGLPVDLGNGVRFGRVPSIYSIHLEGMLKEVGERHASAPSGLALITEYDGAPWAAADASQAAGFTMAEAAEQAIQLAAVSLWLAGPTELSFCLIAQLPEKGRPYPNVFPVLRVPPRFSFGTVTPESIREARVINDLLARISTRTTVFVATRYLWIATHEDAGDLLLGILSIAVEALLGPEDHRNVGARIPRRGAALLGGSRAEQCLTYVRLAAWWKARCEVMHGDTLEHRPDSDKARLVTEAVEIVRLGIRKALLDPSVAKEFATFSDRDSYLERVAATFSEPTPAEMIAARAAR